VPARRGDRRPGDHDQHGGPGARDRPLTAERRPFRRSISLGAATEDKRAEFVSIAGRTPVAEVMAAARRHALDRRTRVMLSDACISALARSA
jgi:hypothetical protein